MVDALQRIHETLETDGLLVDTQPVSPHPPIKAEGRRLGTLDMREWLRTIAAVDALVAQTVQAGIYSLESDERVIVSDRWDSVGECVDAIAGWQGTRVPDGLAERVLSASAPVTVDQEVRLRILRAR